MGKCRVESWSQWSRTVLLGGLLIVAACGGETTPTPEEPCLRDDQCDDGIFCNGAERCDPTSDDADLQGCVYLAAPCLSGQTCDEDSARCLTDCDLDGDADDDGVPSMDCGGLDCDDSDPDRYPGATELCDSEHVDEDCDPSTVGSRDLDGDGEIASFCCNRNAAGELLCGPDCNDAQRSINSSTSEVCDGFDNNCDGVVDTGTTVTGFVDADGDGIGNSDLPTFACAGVAGFATLGGDCDDNDPSIRPGWVELCDGIDNNCNDLIDESATDVPWYYDGDGDGYGVAGSGEQTPIVSCAPTSGFALFSGDCDDTNPEINPSAPERCNGVDDNCNGRPDYQIAPGDLEDDDLDGAPDPHCPAAAVAAAGRELDCDDLDSTNAPGLMESCDRRDNDCDGSVDEDVVSIPRYADRDGDGYGNPADVVEDCAPISGRVNRAGDCNDNNVNINPDRTDGCDGTVGVDDNCNGTIDETRDETGYFFDADGDGVGSGEVTLRCAPGTSEVELTGDCAPLDPMVFAGASEDCTDGVDQDCDTLVDCDDSDCDLDAACARTHILRILEGGGQAVQVNDYYPQPVVLRLTFLDGSETPAPGADITLASPAFGAIARTVTTDSNGIARFFLRAPTVPGTSSALFSVTGARPAAASFTAQAPAAGTLVTLVNANFTYSSTLNAGEVPAAEARSSGASSTVVAADGTIYFPSRIGRVVEAMTPAGVVTRVAGTGGTGSTGDYGAALDATLSSPSRVTLDEGGGRRRLVVGTGSRIRAIDLHTGVITTLAGGGTTPVLNGDGRPAFSVSLGSVCGLAAGGDGSIYFADASSSGLFRVGLDGILHKLLEAGEGDARVGFVGFASNVCALAIDASGTDDRVVAVANIRGSSVNSNYYGVAGSFRMELDGSLTHLLGYSGGTSSDGVQSVRSAIGSDTSIAVADDGALYYTGAAAIRRVDPTTGQVFVIAGTSVAGNAGDGGPALAAELDAPRGLSFHPDGHLIIADANNYAIRAMWGPIESAMRSATLERVSAATSTVRVNAGVGPFVTRLVADDGSALDGREVHFRGPTGSYLGSPDAISAGALAQTTARVGLSAGTQTFTARAYDLLGAEVTGSPVNFTVTVEEPDPGDVFTIANIDKIAGVPTEGNAVASRINYPAGVAADNAGNLYIAASYNHAIYRVDSTGTLTRFAGTGTNSTGGDYANRLDSTFSYPSGVCVEDSATRRRLYVVDSGPVYDRIRYIDLDDPAGPVLPFAGGVDAGSPGYGDGGPATSASLRGVAGCVVDPVDGDVVFVDQTVQRVRQVDPDTNLITGLLDSSSTGNTFAPDGTMTTTRLVSANSAQVAFDAAGELYLYAGFNNSAVLGTSGGSNAALAIFHIDGSDWHHLAGYYTTTTYAVGVPATESRLLSGGSIVRAFIVTPTGRPIWAVSGSSDYRVWTIASDGTMSPFMGDGVYGATGEHVPASSATGVYEVRGLTYWDGHLVMADALAHTVRMVW